MKQLTSDQWIRRAAVLIRLRHVRAMPLARRRRMLISTRRH
jgi:hypothetical protein